MPLRTRHLVVLAVLAVGCGGESSTFSPPPAEGGLAGSGGKSSGGSANGGSQSAGGSGQSGAGGSGQSGAGGSGQSGAGGVTGAGGSAADAGPCPAPADPNDTAMCVTFSPEDVQAENDPGLDKRGVFVVQIFDTPNPPKQNAGQIALFERVVPASSATGGQIALDALISAPSSSTIRDRSPRGTSATDRGSAA